MSDVEALENERMMGDLRIDCVVSIMDRKAHEVYGIKEKLGMYNIKHAKWIPLEQHDEHDVFRHLDIARAYIKDMLPEHNILLHCQIDMSSHLSLIVAAIMKEFGLDYHHAHIFAKRRRHIDEPNNKIDERLERFEDYIRKTHPHHWKLQTE